MEAMSPKRALWLNGAADALELLARAFSFPDTELAEALSDGRFQQDAASCAEDMGIQDAVAAPIEALQASVGCDAAKMLADMKKDFSALYLVPGSKRVIFPYEGAFRFIADGRPGYPLVFQNNAAVDVTKKMRAANVEPDESRHEPADSIWFELAFLSLLYGRVLHDEGGRAASIGPDDWQTIEDFQEEHCLPWQLAFMSLTQERAEQRKAFLYRDLAKMGEVFLRAILIPNEEN